MNTISVSLRLGVDGIEYDGKELSGGEDDMRGLAMAIIRKLDEGIKREDRRKSSGACSS